MYFPYFMTYIAIGLIISVPVFLWALKNGQFRDQQRARFLPLEKDDPDMPPARYVKIEVAGLFLLAVSGLLSSAAVLIWSIMFVK